MFRAGNRRFAEGGVGSDFQVEVGPIFLGAPGEPGSSGGEPAPVVGV